MKKATMKNCGCEVKIEDLVKINNVARCPKHPKNGIDHVVADCDGGCGKTLTRTRGPYLVIKCEECRANDERARAMAYRIANTHRVKYS